MDYKVEDRNKSLERTAAVCRFLHPICVVAFLAIGFWTLFVVAIMVISTITGEQSDSSRPFALVVPIIYAVYGANSCIIPFLLGKMLKDISQHKSPFTLQNAKRLRFFALILVIYSLLGHLLATADSQFTMDIQNHSVETGSIVRDFASNAGTALDIFPLVMAAVFFALSFVFKYGVLLQQESDETL